VSKRRPKRRAGRQRAASQRSLYIFGALVTLMAVGVVIGIAVATSGGGSSPAAIVAPTARPTNIPQDGRVLGSSDAPVAIVEYLDFQCPFCRRAAEQVMPTIEETFIAQGTAFLEIRPIAILGDESVQAAAAAECANEQGQFWAYSDFLFANQGAERGGSFSDDRLKEFAQMLNLDTGAFNSCLDSGPYAQQVVNDTSAARALGIGTTPTVLVDGERVDTTVEAISAAVQQAAGQ
jgi:protein-disulfide isomerase